MSGLLRSIHLFGVRQLPRLLEQSSGRRIEAERIVGLAGDDVGRICLGRIIYSCAVTSSSYEYWTPIRPPIARLQSLGVECAIIQRAID